MLWSAACTKDVTMATSVLYAGYHVNFFARKQKPVTDFLFRCQLLCQFCIYAAVLDIHLLVFLHWLLRIEMLLHRVWRWSLCINIFHQQLSHPTAKSQYDWLVNASAAVTGKGLHNKRLPTICICTHFTRRVLLVSTENNVGVTIVELPIVLLGPMGHLRRYIYMRTV